MNDLHVLSKRHRAIASVVIVAGLAIHFSPFAIRTMGFAMWGWGLLITLLGMSLVFVCQLRQRPVLVLLLVALCATGFEAATSPGHAIGGGAPFWLIGMLALILVLGAECVGWTWPTSTALVVLSLRIAGAAMILLALAIDPTAVRRGAETLFRAVIRNSFGSDGFGRYVGFLINQYSLLGMGLLFVPRLLKLGAEDPAQVPQESTS